MNSKRRTKKRLFADRRVVRLLERIRSSLWVLPGTMAIMAILAAKLLVNFANPSWLSANFVSTWLYSGSSVDAHVLLSSVATAMITVFGVVLSVTVVTLSFASTHLGPRLLREFMQDRSTQFMLGSCVGTFLFCMTVLSATHSGEDTNVPRMAITLGMILTVASFVVLIHFIHHTVRRIQVDNVVEDVSNDLVKSIDRLYPRDWQDESNGPVKHDQTDCCRLYAPREGYVQAIDFEFLLKRAESGGCQIESLVKPADFVVQDGVLAQVTGTPSDDELKDMTRAFVIGAQPTEVQDVEYSIRQLVEIALRALSPGVNDPFTAIKCIDQLGAAMAHFVRKDAPKVVRHPDTSDPVIISPSVGFEGAMDMAWCQLRQHGAEQPAVAIRILESLTRVKELSPCGIRSAVIEGHGTNIHQAALKSKLLEVDEKVITARHARLLSTQKRAPRNRNAQASA